MIIIPSIYEGRGKKGDFKWMIKQKRYDNCLFIFNDNEEYHNTDIEGKGNAVIRKYNKFSEYEPPRSAGIPTGTLKKGGYKTLNEGKNAIDKSIREIKSLIKKYNYEKIYFSSDNEGNLGVSIFEPHRDIIEYITDKIYEF